MSSGFSANQYDNAFKSQRLQNWCQPKHFKERPTAKSGKTRVIVDDRGHLLPGLKQGGSSWPDFKGTWELPARIPARSICPTARSEQGLKRLQTWGFVTPRPDTARTAGGNTEREGKTERGGGAEAEGRTEAEGGAEVEGRRSTQQQEKTEDAAHSGQTQPPQQEKKGTPTPEPSATGRDSSRSKQAEVKDKVKICE